MKIIYLFAAFFCLLVYLLPNHYQPWLSVYQDSCMFIAALLLAYSLFQKKEIEIPYHIFFFILLVLGFICGKQDQLIKSFNLNKKIYFLYGVVLALMIIIVIYDYKRIENEHELMRYENVQLRNIDINGIEPKAILLNQLSEYIWFVRQPISTDISAQQYNRFFIL